MSFVFDRFVTHLVSLLQLTRIRDDNFDLIAELVDANFPAPTDTLQRAPPVQIGIGLVAEPGPGVGVTSLG